MATSAFKSTSRRGTAAEPKAPPSSAAASRRRSHSVSAVSRKSYPPLNNSTPIAADFSNSRDNPLFWATSSSPPDGEENGNTAAIATRDNKQPCSPSARNSTNGNGGSIKSVGERRGRSITRSFSENNGIGRSLSRVRGRSVSRAPSKGAYESENEQVMVASIKKIGNGMNRNSVVKNRVEKRGHAKGRGVISSQNRATEWSEDDSACSLQISNLEDGISVGSLSEVEELSAFRCNNVKSVTATNVARKPSDLVNPETVELISDIRREYSTKLEESEERARKLREDLAIEEQRGQELDRVLTEILPDPKTCAIQRSRRERRTSKERKRMSKRLSEEAMSYFDECVSLSTFDSSDLSASEDLFVGVSSLLDASPTTSFCYDQKQVQPLYNREDSVLTSQFYEFSFADKKPKNAESEEEIKNYIKKLERGTKRNDDLEATISYYDAGEYTGVESVLMDRVMYKSSIESGGLLLCGGAISVFPFGSVM
ncbi:hypothetical protein ABFX02_02G107100 [Erythranthe guttata]